MIEDEERIGRLAARALRSDGHSTQIAASGATGLAMALESPWDLVLLDLMLPDMNGTQVLEAVRRTKPTQRVVVMSAVPEIGTRVNVLESGASDFIPKPFALAELLARVRARLREPSVTTSRWIEAGQLRMDTHTRQVTIADRRFSLSQREFMLLVQLVQRAGQVCRRDELLQDVWGLDFDPGSNVVDVSIRRLRTKLPKPMIETVWNVGYCLIAD